MTKTVGQIYRDEKRYEQFNAEPVLRRVEELIEEGKPRRMYEVYADLSIFDWWVDILTVTRMKQMRSFLKEAIKLGYTGYVCFKVGATGCANGMWAHKRESEDGYSPDGDCLYRSFTPAYVRWDFRIRGVWCCDVRSQLGLNSNEDIKTAKEMEEKLEYFKNLIETIDKSKEV